MKAIDYSLVRSYFYSAIYETIIVVYNFVMTLFNFTLQYVENKCIGTNIHLVTTEISSFRYP